MFVYNSIVHFFFYNLETSWSSGPHLSLWYCRCPNLINVNFISFSILAMVMPGVLATGAPVPVAMTLVPLVVPLMTLGALVTLVMMLGALVTPVMALGALVAPVLVAMTLGST